MSTPPTTEHIKSQEDQNSTIAFIRSRLGYLPGIEARERSKRKGRTQEEMEQIFEKFADNLKRIERIAGKKGGLDRLKKLVYKNCIIDEQAISKDYIDQHILRGREIDEAQITDEVRHQIIQIFIEDQQESLDAWMDYLTSEKTKHYPTWLKMWIFYEVIKLTNYDPHRKKFKKRSKRTIRPFPTLNPKALNHIADLIEAKINKEDFEKLLGQEEIDGDQKIRSLMKQPVFRNLYAHALEKFSLTIEDDLKETKGEWIGFSGVLDVERLTESLRGFNLGGLCVARRIHATEYLAQRGNTLYVFYSGEKKQPRVIISVGKKADQPQEDGKLQVLQVGGIAIGQNLDRHILHQVQEKLKTLPGSETFLEGTKNIEKVNLLEEKIERGERLSTEELCLLYEVDSQLKGVKNSTEPRVQGLIDQRNQSEDIIRMATFKGYKSKDEMKAFFERVRAEMRRRRDKLGKMKKSAAALQAENEMEWGKIAQEELRQQRLAEEEAVRVREDKIREKWLIYKAISVLAAFYLSLGILLKLSDTDPEDPCDPSLQGWVMCNEVFNHPMSEISRNSLRQIKKNLRELLDL